MPVILPPPLHTTLLAAADAAGASRIRARASWLHAQLTAHAPPLVAVRPGCKIALLRCDPPPCVELWAVADGEITSDWEVAL